MTMKMEKTDTESDKAVPDRVLEAVKKTLVNVEELSAKFDQFLSLSTDPDVLAELSPLQRAQSFLLLARATSALFTVRLRCAGTDPDGHPIRRELERLSRYQAKIERFVSLSKAPVVPTTKLNYQAATRFIEHSLPDLTPGQRQSMREISRNQARRVNPIGQNFQKKRKYHSPEKKSVQASAQEFLEKAARELLGDNHAELKGPLNPIMIEDSSDEEVDENNKEEDGDGFTGEEDGAPIVIDSSDDE